MKRPPKGSHLGPLAPKTVLHLPSIWGFAFFVVVVLLCLFGIGSYYVVLTDPELFM